jgi:perosamine synthetase
MNQAKIPFGRPMLDAEELEAVSRILSGPQLVHGPATAEFEKRFAERCGAKHATAVSSCTAGLHLSLFVKDIGAGDEVIVPAMTHVATAHAVEFCRARPVFVDVEPGTGNIDPAHISASLTGQTRAIIVVHFLGLPCSMDRIMSIADGARAFVVEDCAIAVDATFRGRKVGNFGMTGCFSFYPVKHLTTIEGGMVTTNDDAVARLVGSRKAFGYDRTVAERAKPGIYDVTALGYNYRMNEVEAAVGLVQLGKLDRFQAVRAFNHRALSKELADITEVTVFPDVVGEAVSSHYCLNAILPRGGPIDRDAVAAELNAAGIGTSVHYPKAVPLFTYYREKYGYRPGQYPNAEWIAAQSISLPVGPHLSETDPKRIAAALKAAISRARR